MASDPMRIVGKQVRVIFPDGLPRGLDASQVKLVVTTRKVNLPATSAKATGPVTLNRTATVTEYR